MIARNGNEIDLLAAWKASYKTWAGTVPGAVWDVNSTANFAVAGSPTIFNNSDVVVFDDSSSNNTVNVVAGGVRPGSPLTFANNTNAYTVNGGGIYDSPGGSDDADRLRRRPRHVEQRQWLYRRHATQQPQHAHAWRGGGAQRQLHGSVVRYQHAPVRRVDDRRGEVRQ